MSLGLLVPSHVSLLTYCLAELLQLHERGLLIAHSSRIAIAYNLRDHGKALILPMTQVDVDIWIKALFVAHGLLKILSILSMTDERVGGERFCVYIGGPIRERHFILRFLSCLLLWIRYVV